MSRLDQPPATPVRPVLLVEDNESDEKLILRSLRRANVANPVLVVRDGAEALDYLLARGEHAGRRTEADPSLVLLDIKLPKLDGHEVLRALRQEARTALLPVVMLTSSDEERDLIESYQNGANSYVRKPVQFEAFVKAVVQLGLYWLLLNESPPPRR